MGREIKRVPLDFDWPIDKAWEGFLRPTSLRDEKCPDCLDGQTASGWWLQRFCQRLSMLADDIRHQERGRPLHPWLANDPYPVADGINSFGIPTRVLRPSRDILPLIAGLTEQSEEKILGAGGSGNNYIMYRKIVETAGLEDWGGCDKCDGDGTLESYPGQRADAEAWERTEPPEGEGWQLWETVTEGSPISPVFATDEELAQWMASPAYTWGASKPLTIEQAQAFVKVGWASSMIFDSTHGLRQGDAIYADEP